MSGGVLSDPWCLVSGGGRGSRVARLETEERVEGGAGASKVLLLTRSLTVHHFSRKRNLGNNIRTVFPLTDLLLLI